jgi:uncharacterized protein (DUF433 family)
LPGASLDHPPCHRSRRRDRGGPKIGSPPNALAQAARAGQCKDVVSLGVFGAYGYGDSMTPSHHEGRHALIDDPHYTAPLYRKAEAARIVRVPASTLREWAAGVAGPLRPMKIHQSYIASMAGARLDNPPALITTVEPVTPRGPSVPFVGLAEAFVLAAFRSAGVPMQRIRPAVSWLQENIGLTQALASERLKTDGAEVLWDYGHRTQDMGLVGDLVVIRNGQQVFRPVVNSYLRRVTYENGWARVINVGADRIEVIVDPWINGGQPTLTRRGVAVQDVLSRIRAGEPPGMVADDYGLRPAEMTAILALAA